MVVLSADYASATWTSFTFLYWYFMAGVAVANWLLDGVLYSDLLVSSPCSYYKSKWWWLTIPSSSSTVTIFIESAGSGWIYARLQAFRRDLAASKASSEQLRVSGVSTRFSSDWVEAAWWLTSELAWDISSLVLILNYAAVNWCSA